MEKGDSLLVSVDIGTYKISVLVAEPVPEGLNVLGIGSAPSEGVRKGLITNIEKVVQSLQKAVKEAEMAASCEIHNVFAAVTGGHMGGLSSQGVVRVKAGEVSADDVEEAVAVAQAIALPPECEILHVFPQVFLVDGQDRGDQPVGATGVRLETNVHAVSVASNALEALQKCCERAGLYLNGAHYAGLASAESVLTPEEKELGVVLLDIGAGTTSVAAFYRGVVYHTAVLPVGSENITNDLAAVLGIPMAEAEKLKQRFGCALMSLIAPGEMIDMPSIGDREAAPIPRRKMSEIIEPRVEEIFELVREQLEVEGLLENLGAGAVLTGGGAILEGMPDLAQRVFRLTARRGMPRYMGGVVDDVSSPSYAANVGLVLSNMKQHSGFRPLAKIRGGRNWNRMRERVVEWFKDFF